VPLFAGIGVVVALIVAGGLYAWLGAKPAAPTSVASPTTMPAVGTAPATAGAAPGLTAANDAASSPAATIAVRPATTVAPPPAGPFDPAHEFERVAATQSPDFKVVAAADKPQLRIDKDEMSFQVKSEKDGFLYVFQYGSDGGIVQIFPNGVAKSNKIRAESVLSLPGKGAWHLPVGGPPGTDRLLAVVSKYPRDFSSLGLKPQGGFDQTTLDAASQAAQAQGAGASIFAGKAICQQPCTDDFGASLFTAEEIK
jgi:hypothetical protein